MDEKYRHCTLERLRYLIKIMRKRKERLEKEIMRVEKVMKQKGEGE